MDKASVLRQTEEYVHSTLAGEGTGHDWWHIYRVRNVALRIGKKEGADLFIVELAALLHDIADWKFHDGDDTKGSHVSRQWLESLKVEESVIDHVCEIVDHVSFKGAGVVSQIHTKEGMAVQDADRLDALGAIGIARAFAYGGHKGRELYNPQIPPEKHESFEQYKKSVGTTINHFYEKLFLLRDRMNTEEGKRIAEERRQFMSRFVDQFLQEWESKDT